MDCLIGIEDDKHDYSMQSRTCNVCHKFFASGNKLYTHLKEYPSHQARKDDITYIIKCNIEQDGWGNILQIIL